MNLNTIILAYIHKNGSATGYNVTRFLKGKTNHLHQQVYKELNRLEHKGILASKIEPREGKPAAKVYSYARNGKVFAYPSADSSDFSKTPIACSLVVEDILNDTNDFDKYIKTMEDAESICIHDIKYSDLNHTSNH